jgi:hypothetical protein
MVDERAGVSGEQSDERVSEREGVVWEEGEGGRPAGGGKVRGKECVGKEKADNGGWKDLRSGDLEMDLGEKLGLFRSVVSGGDDKHGPVERN